MAEIVILANSFDKVEEEARITARRRPRSIKRKAFNR